MNEPLLYQPLLIARLIVQGLAFIASIFATVWAIELYSLLRTGEVGRTWRIVVIATVIFGVSQVVQFGEFFEYLPQLHLYEFLQLPFIIILAYACYAQRRAFFMPRYFRRLLASRQERRSEPSPHQLATSGFEDVFEEDDLEAVEQVRKGE